MIPKESSPWSASSPDQPGDLRQRAARRAHEQAASGPTGPNAPALEETLRLLHELQVHKIELEMQNEELCRAQEELEAARAKYFELYDLAPVGYFTLSEPGVILEANLTAARLLGVARSALAGQLFSGFVLHEERDNFHLQRMKLREKGTEHSWEMRMMRADSSSFWAHVEAAQVRDGGSRVTLHDISERKQAEATLARTEARLRQLQKAESLERMAGAIAHHFNNKLQVVLGNMELALGEPALDARSAWFLKEALLATREAGEMNTLMLTFLGQAAGTREPLDLSQSCRGMLPLLRASLPVGLTLEIDLPSPGPIVNADAQQIRQLLVNLVTNAGEAFGSGQGVIRLVVTTVSPAGIPEGHRFPVDWEPQNLAFACLEVSDTGRGIASKDFEMIFDPFFSDKETGRGLGLAVVLGIVRAHGGAVTVWSEPGRGSTFWIFLPLSVEKGPASAPQPAPELAAGGVVLIVEDEDLVRTVAAAMLRSLGFSVLEARGGSEAVELFGRHPAEVRLVLCDLIMPGMNGWETLTTLRKLAPGIPVILTSGYDRAQAMAGSHPEVPQAYLRKPFLLKDLTEAIRRALRAETATG